MIVKITRKGPSNLRPIDIRNAHGNTHRCFICQHLDPRLSNYDERYCSKYRVIVPVNFTCSDFKKEK